LHERSIMTKVHRSLGARPSVLKEAFGLVLVPEHDPCVCCMQLSTV